MIDGMNPPPLLFCFGLHAHQPVGNFDHVFQEHLRDVYRPFLEKAVEQDFLPLTVHLSGPLLDWMDGNSPSYLDLLGELAATGKLEILLSGYYEPILPSLGREDRIEQVSWMRDAVKARFGVDARGLWLTERVWEPELPADLAEAGIDYVLVDDRHFVAAGFSRADLHRPFRTESGGKGLAVFAIDEKLRYLIPFHDPEQTRAYLAELRETGRYLAVAADDIEKFGGWPGTREWVYDRGWLDRFLQMVGRMRTDGMVRLATLSEALDTLPSGGLAYLPSASYREMEEWALPTQANLRLADLTEELGEGRLTEGESPLVRGSHWRNFLVKYPEANRMHKKAMALSRLCRERGNPPAARQAIGRAQCNDAYWHGVFGGLYLRHLRDSVWRNLSEAEGRMRGGEAPGAEATDLDMDGHEEIWIHSGDFSALVSPARGGAVEELTIFRTGVNLANTLTRRREPYHKVEEHGGSHGGGPDTSHQEDAGSDMEAEGRAHPPQGADQTEGTPSIHELEAGLHFDLLPPVDGEDRALFVERVLPGALSREEYVKGDWEAVHSWARESLAVQAVETSDEGVLVRLHGSGPVAMEKILHFEEDGTLTVSFSWDPVSFPPGSFFSTEISLAGVAKFETDHPDHQPGPDDVSDPWRFPIATFSKSERGFDETIQGESLTYRWPVASGHARVRLIPG